MDNQLDDQVEKQMIKKAQGNYELVRDWLEGRLRGKRLVDYFIKRNIHSIVIYGGGDLGQLLLEELDHSSVECLYCLDNNADNLFLRVPAYPYTGQIIKADAIVV